MSFLSLNFAVFLGFGMLVFQFTHGQWRRHVLLVLSYAFYFTWSPLDAVLLFGISLAVYFTALFIERNRSGRQKLTLVMLAATSLLLLLGFFKCVGSFAPAISRFLGQSAGNTIVDIVAPIGLSYYLFKTMGYLLDVYWEKIPAQRSLVSLALYVSFFPQILSGPIQRAGDFFGQLDKLTSPLPDEIVEGLRRILFGLFKKVVIADRLSASVAAVHANPSGYSPLELVFGAYLFAFQIYTDFSGLTDIGIGIGLLFGIKGPENFNMPFFARNIQEFWRRWHISLTSWLTDYVFMPLRVALRSFGNLGLSVAIFVTMVAVGIWHGPKMTYAAFGALNGVYMIVSALTLKKRSAFFQKRPILARLRKFAGPLLTFHLIVFALILFRANSLHSGLLYVTHMIPGFQSSGIPATRFDCALLPITLLFVGVCLVAMESVNWASSQSVWVARFASAPWFVRWVGYYALIVIIAGYVVQIRTFIYAQF